MYLTPNYSIYSIQCTFSTVLRGSVDGPRCPYPWTNISTRSMAVQLLMVMMRPLFVLYTFAADGAACPENIRSAQSSPAVVLRLRHTPLLTHRSQPYLLPRLLHIRSIVRRILMTAIFVRHNTLVHVYWLLNVVSRGWQSVRGNNNFPLKTDSTEGSPPAPIFWSYAFHCYTIFVVVPSPDPGRAPFQSDSNNNDSNNNNNNNNFNKHRWYRQKSIQHPSSK